MLPQGIFIGSYKRLFSSTFDWGHTRYQEKNKLNVKVSSRIYDEMELKSTLDFSDCMLNVLSIATCSKTFTLTSESACIYEADKQFYNQVHDTEHTNFFPFLHNFPHMWNNNVKNSFSRFVVNAKWVYAYKYHVVLLRKRQPVLLLLLQPYEVWLKVIYPCYKCFMIVDWFHNESVFIWFQKFKKCMNNLLKLLMLIKSQL